MSRLYFWIGFDEIYKISSIPCVNVNMDDKISLQMLRDSDFCKKIELGGRISIKLVSYVSTVGEVKAKDNILRHMNTEYEDENVRIEKEIDIILPERLNDIYNSDKNDVIYYDTSRFDEEKDFSTIKIIDGDFSLNLTYCKNGGESYYFYSHPTIIIDNN